jgi:2-polyprenyl-3-methyl-5-hydroxy-6-metoxy-1,4-benzoquinol methylase
LKARPGAEVWGVEIDPAAAEEARKKLDRVITGDVAAVTAALPDAYFDCIIANDVLEHLADPWKVLAGFRPKLKEKGVLVCSVPNVRFIINLRGLVYHGRWNYVDEGTLDRTHLRFFTRESVREMMENAGYEMVALTGINPVRSWKFAVLDALTLGRFRDMKYFQFAVVARVRGA